MPRKNDKPNHPEEFNQCSWRALKAGGHWMFLVFLTDVPGAYLLSHYPDWPFVLRTLVALLPLIAGVLYVQSTVRWIRGMDELHQRITQAAFLSATVTYLLLSVAWELLRRTGAFEIILQATNLHLELMPFANCTFAIGLTYVLFGIGYTHVFNRRYR